jgi:hypothetical protein
MRSGTDIEMNTRLHSARRVPTIGTVAALSVQPARGAAPVRIVQARALAGVGMASMVRAGRR